MMSFGFGWKNLYKKVASLALYSFQNELVEFAEDSIDRRIVESDRRWSDVAGECARDRQNVRGVAESAHARSVQGYWQDRSSQFRKGSCRGESLFHNY